MDRLSELTKPQLQRPQTVADAGWRHLCARRSPKGLLTAGTAAATGRAGSTLRLQPHADTRRAASPRGRGRGNDSPDARRVRRPDGRDRDPRDLFRSDTPGGRRPSRLSCPDDRPRTARRTRLRCSTRSTRSPISARWGDVQLRLSPVPLSAACGNARLLGLIEAQHNAADRYVRILLSNLDYRARSQVEHRELLAACRKRDASQR